MDSVKYEYSYGTLDMAIAEGPPNACLIGPGVEPGSRSATSPHPREAIAIDSSPSHASTSNAALPPYRALTLPRRQQGRSDSKSPQILLSTVSTSWWPPSSLSPPRPASPTSPSPPSSAPSPPQQRKAPPRSFTAPISQVSHLREAMSRVSQRAGPSGMLQRSVRLD